MIKTFVLCALAGLAAAEDNSTTTVGDVSMELLGASSQIKLFRDGTDGFIKIKMQKLQETDESGGTGGLNKVSTFANKGEWGDVTEVALGESLAVAWSATYEAELEVGDATVDFELTVWLTEEEEATVENGNLTVTVPPYGLKFDTRIANWPFEEETNTLAFGIRVTAASDSGDDVEGTEAETDDGDVVVDLPGVGTIDAPTQALVDGSDAEITVDVDIGTTNTDISFMFPNFAEEVVYDPVVALDSDGDDDDNTNSGARAAGTLLGAVAGVTFVLCALLAGLAAAEDNSTTTVGDVSMELLGASSQIKLFRDGTDGFIKIKMQKLEETNESGGTGGLNKVSTFANKGTWGDLTEVALGETEAAAWSATYEADLDVDDATVDFELTVWLTEEEATVETGNLTVTVPSYGLKFDTRIANWPFEADTNTLAFGIRVTATTNSGDDAEVTEEETDDGDVVVDLAGAGTIDAPTQAVVDGSDADITVTVDASTTNTDISFMFPNFASEVVYDPVVALDDDDDTMSGGARAAGGALLGAVAGVMGLLLL